MEAFDDDDHEQIEPLYDNDDNEQLEPFEEFYGLEKSLKNFNVYGMVKVCNNKMLVYGISLSTKNQQKDILETYPLELAYPLGLKDKESITILFSANLDFTRIDDVVQLSFHVLNEQSFELEEFLTSDKFHEKVGQTVIKVGYYAATNDRPPTD